MGLLDLWNNLFTAKKSISSRIKRKDKKNQPSKKSVKKTQYKTKAAKKKTKKSSTKKHSKQVIKTTRVKKKAASVKVRKHVKESSVHGGAETVKKIPKHTKKLDKKPKEKLIGIVTHYFGKVYAAAISLKVSLKVGDKIHIKGAHDDFTQIVSSMQINRIDILSANKGKEVGIKVLKPVHANDKVYLVRE